MPPAQQSLKLVMALKVRDEGDVIEHNLRFHRAQGVDFFIVTDNGSVDETPQILKRWVDAGLARVIDEPGNDMADHGHEWVTRMAREAATEHGADWVIHADADEFWWPLEGTVKEALAAIPPEYGVVISPRTEFLARPDGPDEFFERLTIRESRALLRPKVAHRGIADALVLHRGQHEVTVGGDLSDAWEYVRPPGRAALRTVRAEGGEEVDERLIWAPRFPILTLHFPLRSFAHYRSRVELVLDDSSMGTPGMRERLSQAISEDRLEGLYGELLEDERGVERGLADGRLVRDERLRDYMRALPEGDPRPAAVPARSAEELAAERAALERDAMHVIGRTDRMLMIRNDQMRARVRTLERESRRPELTRRPGRWRSLGEEIRVVMAVTASNAEDVIHHNLRYHRAQGVDFFVVTDNGSTDRTPEILERWEKAGLAKVFSRSADESGEKAGKRLTHMARRAATHEGADWVIHADADEFWWPLSGSIRDALGSIPPEYDVVVGPRTEFLARPEDSAEFYERMTLRMARSLLAPKLAHRAYPDVLVIGGARPDVTVGDDLTDAFRRVRPQQRQVVGGLRPTAEDRTRDRLVPSPRHPLRVFSYPVRSYDQYHRSVAAIFAGEDSGETAGSGLRARIREALEEDRLDGLYEKLTSDKTEDQLADGTLVADERLRNFMQRVPDPFGDAVPAAVPVWEHPDEDALAAEEAQLEFEAMHMLAQSHRAVALHDERAKLRIQELSTRSARLRAVVKELQTASNNRPLRRARRLVGRLLGRGKKASAGKKKSGGKKKKSGGRKG